MWPHSITVGLGRTAVAVGSDDSSIIEGLEPWRIDVERDVVDLAIEISPAQPSDRSAPRTLPNLRHGSDRIATSTDVSMLRDALMRVLAAHETRHATGFLRLPGMVLVRNGVGTLVPLSSARLVGQRQLERMGYEPVTAQSVLVDAGTCEAVIDAPLGSGAPVRRIPLAAVWLFHREPEAPVSPGIIVARVLGNAIGHVEVHDAMTLTRSVPVRFLESGRSPLEKALTAP